MLALQLERAREFAMLRALGMTDAFDGRRADFSGINGRRDLFLSLVAHDDEDVTQLEDMLDQVAQAYDEEVEVQTAKVTSLMEPLIIVGMALVVGFIVISVMLPILKISDMDNIRRK